MKRIILLLVIVLPLGCNSFGVKINEEALPSSPKNYHGYQPIDPLLAEKVSLYNATDGKPREQYWAQLSKEETLKLLPLQSAQVSVQKTDASGKISYLVASLSGDTGSYTVIMDYMKYRVEPVKNDSDEFIGNGRVGVGLRIKAVVTTTKANLNLGSLFAIGLEAQSGNLKGGISVDVIGIDSADVTNLIPLTSAIDQTSIQNALQALASIKTKIFDKNTTLTPHLIAIEQNKSGTAETIKEKLSASKKKGMELAQVRLALKNEILSAVSQNGELEMNKWVALVDKTDLPENDKTALKALTTVADINKRLIPDAAMNGRIISALSCAIK